MDEPSPARAQDTPSKIRQLLERLGIDPRDPWVWLTTERPLSPDHTRARIDDGGAARWIPLTEGAVKAWNGYSFDLIGIRWEATPEFLGLLQNWGDDLLLDVRYMRVQWQQSAPYAEYVASEREGEGYGVRGRTTADSQDDLNRAEAGLALLLDIPRRKPGPKRDLEPEELRQAVVAAIRAEWIRLRERPALRHIALYFSLHPTLPRCTEGSLGRRIRRASLDLKELYHEAEATLPIRPNMSAPAVQP